MSANWVAATVRSGLYTRIIGKRIRFFQELTSTMDLAREYAESKIDEGTVVIAESQTSSRGRLDAPGFLNLGTCICLLFYTRIR